MLNDRNIFNIVFLRGCLVSPKMGWKPPIMWAPMSFCAPQCVCLPWNFDGKCVSLALPTQKFVLVVIQLCSSRQILELWARNTGCGARTHFTPFLSNGETGPHGFWSGQGTGAVKLSHLAPTRRINDPRNHWICNIFNIQAFSIRFLHLFALWNCDWDLYTFGCVCFP